MYYINFVPTIYSENAFEKLRKVLRNTNFVRNKEKGHTNIELRIF